MKREVINHYQDIIFTADNPSNIRKVIDRYKNILICGVVGVGKITNTVTAVKENTNVYYIGNPVDYEGKLRPGSYEKYLNYISSLKSDVKIISDISEVFDIKSRIILIIDEIYGRPDNQLMQIGRVFDMENVQVIQIVGCLKNMGSLIDKIDIILELHLDGAFAVDKDLARAICNIFQKRDQEKSKDI